MCGRKPGKTGVTEPKGAKSFKTDGVVVSVKCHREVNSLNLAIRTFTGLVGKETW